MDIKVQTWWRKIAPIEMCLTITSVQIPRGRFLKVFNIVCSRLVVDERCLILVTERK